MLCLLLTLMLASVSVQGSLFGMADHKRLLDLHNKLRKGVKPAAMDMEVMTWDSSLAAASLKWARKCIWKHDPNNSKLKTGENMGLSSHWKATGTQSGLARVQNWYNEVKWYNINSKKCQKGKACGHYTQLVWAKSNRLGCAAYKCTNIKVKGKIWKTGYMVVCKYSPRGNMGGARPYQVGPSCAQCPKKCIGGCKGKLCPQNFVRCEDAYGAGQFGLSGKQYTCKTAKAKKFCTGGYAAFLKKHCAKTCRHCLGWTASSGKRELDKTCKGPGNRSGPKGCCFKRVSGGKLLYNGYKDTIQKGCSSLWSPKTCAALRLVHASSKPCPSTTGNGGKNACTKRCKCGFGQGDCDGNAHCKSGLKCIRKLFRRTDYCCIRRRARTGEKCGNKCPCALKHTCKNGKCVKKKSRWWRGRFAEGVSEDDAEDADPVAIEAEDASAESTDDTASEADVEQDESEADQGSASVVAEVEPEKIAGAAPENENENDMENDVETIDATESALEMESVDEPDAVVQLQGDDAIEEE